MENSCYNEEKLSNIHYKGKNHFPESVLLNTSYFGYERYVLDYIYFKSKEYCELNCVDVLFTTGKYSYDDDHFTFWCGSSYTEGKDLVASNLHTTLDVVDKLIQDGFISLRDPNKTLEENLKISSISYRATEKLYKSDYKPLHKEARFICFEDVDYYHNPVILDDPEKKMDYSSYIEFREKCKKSYRNPDSISENTISMGFTLLCLTPLILILNEGPGVLLLLWCIFIFDKVASEKKKSNEKNYIRYIHKYSDRTGNSDNCNRYDIDEEAGILSLYRRSVDE